MCLLVFSWRVGRIGFARFRGLLRRGLRVSSLACVYFPFLSFPDWGPALGGGAITSDCLAVKPVRFHVEIDYFVVMVLYRLDAFQGFLVSVFGELEVH